MNGCFCKENGRLKVLLIDQIAKVNYKYTYSLANALQKQDIYVELAIDDKSEGENCICKKNNLFKTADKNISKLKKLINYISAWKRIIYFDSKNKDIIHMQWIIFSPLDYLFIKKIKKNNKRVVITIHDILPFNKKFYDYYFHKKIYNLADGIIIQTEENVNRFCELFPDNDALRCMIPHGHFMDYSQTIDKEEARKKLNLPDDKFIFLFFGQIKKVKGLDVLLNAYAELLNKNPDIIDNVLLVVAGNIWKDSVEKYETIIKEKGINNSVIMDIRYIPDNEVDLYYSASNVCVLPYLNVYQSGVLQLTYAHHKATIVSDITAFTDIVTPEIGFICKAGNIEDLKNTMMDAYARRYELDVMAEQGYRYIKNRFDWNQIALDVKKLYTGVEKNAQKKQRNICI